MKKELRKLWITAVAAVFVLTNATAQTTSTFESLTLSTGSYWNGSAMPFGTAFTDGNAIFPNYFDTAWGGLWLSGWAYSNVTDSVTSGFPFSSRPAIGNAASANYAIGQQNAHIRLTGAAFGGVVNGVYVTNSTYAANSMRDGDQFAKQFGGTSGNDPDWFKLTVRKYLGGNMTNDSVEFYLADYRFINNAQDYIVKTWQYVDLTSLGNVDSLEFILTSSDVGQFGMNTPAFFCIDDLTTADSPLALAAANTPAAQLHVYPNPAQDYVVVTLPVQQANAVLEIMDYTGKTVLSKNVNAVSEMLDVSALPAGIYHVSVTGNGFTAKQTFVRCH